MRALLHVTLGLVAIAPAQTAPGTGLPPAPSYDSTPSDPAALGFLRSKVDRRVYSLEGAGAASMEATVHATFEVLARGAKEKPSTVDVVVGADYATGAITRPPLKDVPADQKAVVTAVLGAADNALSFLPSRAATTWRVAFAQEGDLVRLDYQPRQKPSMVIHHFSEWYRPDGTPTRRVVVSNRPVGDTVERVTQEIALAYTEVDHRLLLTALTPVAAEGEMTYTFEYEVVDGFRVLKKLVQKNTGWTLTLDFTTKVKKAAPPAPK